MKAPEEAVEFCRRFFATPQEKRYLFGVNEYSCMLASHVEVGGFIDDFHEQKVVGGLPVMPLANVPDDARVIATLLGRPLTGKRVLDVRNIDHLDFFGFYEHCGLDLPAVRFWGEQRRDFEIHQAHYEWLDTQLVEDQSRTVLRKLMGLRLSGDIRFLDGFTDRQDEQYFEPFLTFEAGTEVFFDIGSFDGQTSLQFIEHCPEYRAIYAFEPERKNAAQVDRTLKQYPRTHVVTKGLAAKSGFARINPAGSATTVGGVGTERIELARLDDYGEVGPTFLKLDIEGGESEALAGAKAIIRNHQPTIACAVYHKPQDLWAIARQILDINSNYELRLRHYTEGVVETVMFFLPTSTR